jgi:hypothetical protein
LTVSICRPTDSGVKDYARDLLKFFVLKDCGVPSRELQAYLDMEHKVLTADDLARGIVLFRKFFDSYVFLVNIMQRAGRVLLGEDHVTSPGYISLEQQHAKCLERLLDVSTRSDTRKVAASLRDLELLFAPEPPDIVRPQS